MSGYNKQFDTKKNVLPDLTIQPNIEMIVAEENEDVSEKDGEPASPLPPTEEEDDEIFVGQKKDVIVNAVVEENVEEQIDPKRGRDKKQRKKRVFTPAMAEALKKAREKKLAIQRKKKTDKLEKIKEDAIHEYKDKQPKQLPPPAEAKKPSFEEFCSVMDRYEEYKRKKNMTKTSSNHPHPNKVVRKGLPRPPMSKGVVQRAPSLLQVQKKTYNKWAF
tara:strand:+ start:397 stop:1050 length:654 start_codon:yes stop_codon:yes gene_type:complete